MTTPGFVSDYINEAISLVGGDGVAVAVPEKHRDRELAQAQVQASIAVALAIEQLTEVIRQQA